MRQQRPKVARGSQTEASWMLGMLDTQPETGRKGCMYAYEREQKPCIRVEWGGTVEDRAEEQHIRRGPGG